jgi:energy-coupling factor transport system substrate-specific component
VLHYGVGRGWSVTVLFLPIAEDRRVRFLVAGSMAAGGTWLVRFPLNLAMPFAAAVVCATAIGMTAGFLLYRTFVFAGSARTWWLQARDFIFVNSLGAAITALVAVALNDFLFVALALKLSAVAHALGIAAGATANYLGHKMITFRLA